MNKVTMEKKIVQGTTTHIVDKEMIQDVLKKELTLSNSDNYKCIYTELISLKQVKTWYEVRIFSVHIIIK